MHVSYSKLSKELKNGIEILVGQAAFKLWIKTVKMFWSITRVERFKPPGQNRLKPGFNRAVLTTRKWSKGGQNPNCNFKLIFGAFLLTFVCKVTFKQAMNFKIYQNIL